MIFAKPILITGGAGFVGSHLIEFLQNKEIPVNVIDNLSSGAKENLSNFLNCNLTIEDCCNESLMDNLIKNSSLVIHLASVVGMKYVIANPLEVIRTNIDSVKVAAKKCAEYKVPLIYFSTSSVYRNHVNSKNSIFKESSDIHNSGFNNASLYSETKVIGESICEHFKKQNQLKCIIVRPFNLIGAKQKSSYGMVVPTFIDAAINKKPLKIFGNGKQSRTFSDVDLAIELLWKLINNKKSYGKIFNLAANDKQISILSLSKKIRRLTNNNLKFEFVPYEKVYGKGYVDVKQRKPSINLIREFAGKWDEIKLDESLLKIYKYHKNNFE